MLADHPCTFDPDRVRSTLESDGFAVVRGALSSTQLAQLRNCLEQLGHHRCTAGVRALGTRIPAVRDLANSTLLKSLCESVLKGDVRLVRSMYFNKSMDANWQVAWHQDLTIAVEERVHVEGFRSWSTKDGILHVQPPPEILERMLSVRLHLDAADESNGALWVAPKTHRLGRIDAGRAAQVAHEHAHVLCQMSAGDALLFRPLLLHASRKATSDRPRRVLHLEFADCELPEPLQWARDG